MDPFERNSPTEYKQGDEEQPATRSIKDKRLQELLKWSENRKRITGTNSGLLYVENPTIKEQDVVTMEREMTHKRHIIESLICHSLGVHLSNIVASTQ